MIFLLFVVYILLQLNSLGFTALPFFIFIVDCTYMQPSYKICMALK